MDPLLEARSLTKTFSSPAPVSLFRGLNLRVPAGASIAITGRSGEGKTTLLHLLGLLDCPDSGEILFRGAPVERRLSSRLRNAHFGFIFQSYNLLEDLTALENVLLPARIGGRRVDARFGVELLARVGLDQRAHFPARALSGGERQRVAIARALCNAPSLIFADEPTGNLDRENSGLVSDLLFSLVREAGASLLLVTHDLELASRCDRQWRLEAGAIGIPNVTQQLVLDRSESSRG